MGKTVTESIVKLAADFRDTVSKLQFGPPVVWVYNPLEYAWAAHRQYLERYAKQPCRVVFLGMNPGPFGMAQTGVPFGEIAAVRDWLGIEMDVQRPAKEHPKRPVDGFACNKSEVSGKRLWGLFAARYKNADSFFQDHFVANYCPLVFMEEGGKNITPDKLERSDAKRLEQVCDEHLCQLLKLLQPGYAIGVGGYAEACLRRCLDKSSNITVGKILHPSPASPAANRDWAGQATNQLVEQGIWEK